MCERVLHLLRRCLGDRMQISLFMWGYFKFNHRWGLGWKIFLLLLVFSPSSNNVKLPTSESFSSSSFWVSRYQRWQIFFTNKQKRQKSVFILLFFQQIKKKKSCSLSYKLQCIFRSMVNIQGSKSLPEKQIKIRKC